MNLEADEDASKAVEAWTLAEVLRQGGGAESLADDLRFACTYAWSGDETARLVSEFPELRRIPTPKDPTRFEGEDDELQVFEWLDRRLPAAGEVATHADLPRVLATVYITPGLIRLSSPRAETLEEVEEKLRRLIGGGAEPAGRVAAPLPLPFLDAGVWTARDPGGHRSDVRPPARPGERGGLLRERVDPPPAARDCDGLSPLAASQGAAPGRRRRPGQARRGGPAAANNSGSRPTAVAMYQGYPFDRLRRRLDLDPIEPESIDPAMTSCQRLATGIARRPTELDDRRLAEVFESAAGFRDDPLSVRFAQSSRQGFGGAEATRPRRRLCSPRPPRRCSAAIPRRPSQLLARARSSAPKTTTAGVSIPGVPRSSRRTGRPAEAASLPSSLVPLPRPPPRSPSTPPRRCSTTVIAPGKRFLAQARDLARSAGIRWVEDRATLLLESHS